MNENETENLDSRDNPDLEYLIRRAKKNLQDIFDGITDAIVIIDKKCEIMRVNRSLLELMGKESFNDVLGKTCFDLFYGVNGPCEKCIGHDVFETGKKQTLLRSFNAEPLKGRIFQVTVFPLHSDEGDAYAIVKYMRDITREINNEKQLLELEKARNMRFLAAGVAHELRNPLAVIKSSAQLCLKELNKLEATPLHSDLKENMDAIINNADNVSHTIKHLMDFSKPLEATYEMADIGSIIDEVCNMVKVRCQRKEISLTKEIQTSIPEIRLDKSSLIQAILNFITNAIDAISVGGDIKIEALFRPDAEFIYIFIKDSGKGVSELVSDHVFEPFFTTKEDGEGLGMTIAHRIINAHGGTVDFESIEERGSVVTIKLPVKETFTGMGALNNG